MFTLSSDPANFCMTLESQLTFSISDYWTPSPAQFLSLLPFSLLLHLCTTSSLHPTASLQCLLLCCRQHSFSISFLWVPKVYPFYTMSLPPNPTLWRQTQHLPSSSLPCDTKPCLPQGKAGSKVCWICKLNVNRLIINYLEEILPVILLIASIKENLYPKKSI